MRNWRGLLALGIATAVANATAASEELSPLATCGHLAELTAAKRALQEGDKASALIHLRNADALLSQCERELDRAVQPTDGESTDETMVGGAEAPPTPVA